MRTRTQCRVKQRRSSKVSLSRPKRAKRARKGKRAWTLLKSEKVPPKLLTRLPRLNLRDRTWQECELRCLLGRRIQRLAIAQLSSVGIEPDGKMSKQGMLSRSTKTSNFQPVRLYRHMWLTTDILILATSEEEDVCYIETKNLDGETNLKSRHGVTGLEHLSTADACSHERLRIDLDAPDVNMYRLNGAAVTLDTLDKDGQPAIHPVTLETTLLRGCLLKNTAWVTGIVLFTGQDTKIIQNSGGTPSKRSKVERQMNPQVLLNLTILGFIAMVCAIVDHFNEVRWYRENAYWMLYADTSGDNPNINGLVTFANAFITFQNIVPISLYISIEFVRTAQAAFIYWDHAIKYVKNGVTTRTMARSWNLSDDLGQIEYVFSDKTGMSDRRRC